MDKQDPNLEQQVWQRVHSGRCEPAGNDLRQLQREVMELAAIYRGMISQVTGKQQELLRRLHQGERSNAEALAGIGKLSRLGGENLRFWQPGKEDFQKTLERCYHRTRRCMTEYLARSADGEFGVVFEQLARREGDHCRMIAEVLGNL